MKANEGYIIRFLEGSDKRFVVPVYQRSYSWKKSDCECLINDLKDVITHKYSSHFFGSIVYVVNNVGSCQEYMIIDGQQRITTISLLLIAIRNYVEYKNIKNGIIVEKITDYLTDKYAPNEKKLKLKLVQGDEEAYDRLIERTQQLSNNDITVNYNYFYNDVLDKMDEVQIKELYDAIMKLIIVNISLEPQKGDDPQLIFESLNSTGRDLEESDKIRNFILMNMDHDRQQKIYKNYWEKIEQKVSKDDINKFIRYYLAIKNRELANEKKLYTAFKEYCKNFDGKIEDVLTDIIRYADYYNRIKKAEIDDKSYLGSIARIIKLDVNTVIPLLFDLFVAKDEGLLNDNEIYEATKIIESFIVRRIICGMPTPPLSRLFVSIGAEIKKYTENGATYLDAFKYAVICKSGKSRFPNDHDFSDKFVSFELYNLKPSARKYIFEMLENFNSRERIAVEEQIDNGVLTIEHIMPQKLTEEWKTQLGEKWELIYAKYLHTVGNLTLTAYNSDYSNSSFQKKKNMSGSGFAYSKLSLNEYIKTCDVWGEKQIKERAEILLSKAVKIWEVPETDFKPAVEEEWISLDDDIDFTGKNFTKMVLMGEEIIVSNFTDAYKKVNTIFYDLDPVKYVSTLSSYFSSREDGLRVAYKVGENAYIEVNSSNQRKVANLCELFALFGIEPQELKFLLKSNKDKPVVDLQNEATYYHVSCGQLAYEMFVKLFADGKLGDGEIEKLMGKEYTRKTFKKAVYPALSTSHDANKGVSNSRRYYKDPIMYKGREIYITKEWPVESREDLINWFKEHYRT